MRRILLLALVAGCIDQPGLDEATVDQDITSSNRLSTNSLAANPVNLVALASVGLKQADDQLTEIVDDPAGREQLAYLVSCALAPQSSITAVDSTGTSYTFQGSLSLADPWKDHAPTAAQRRFVSACMLARTNYFHVAVPLSLRGPDGHLAPSSGEKTTFPALEAAFWGDLFITPQSAAACATSLDLSQPTTGTWPQRVCALPGDGSTTQCNFTYAGSCATACTFDAGNGFYKQCGSVKEIINSFLGAP